MTEKKGFLDLFQDDDELRERKAAVLWEFTRRRISYRSADLLIVANMLSQTRNSADVDAMWLIATRPESKILLPIDKRSKGQVLVSSMKRTKLAKPPGYRVMGFLKLFCSRKFVERELQQTHADAMIELYEAEKAGDRKLARAIPWRLRAHLLVVACSGVLGWFLSKVRLRVGSNGE